MNGKMALLVLFLIGGLAFAIQPVDQWVVGAVGKYASTPYGNVTTEGGNVTQLDLNSNQSTEKWAGFWGNITGRLVLAPNPTDMFYTWSWSPADGGEVCAVVQGGAFDWANVGQAIVAADVSNSWGFNAADVDSAENTIPNGCTVTIGGVSAAGTGNLTGLGNFETCAVADSGTPTSKYNIAFCANISTSSGPLFNGDPGDYELLVATNETAGQFETYQFWIELA